MKKQVNFKFPDRELKQWKLAATARGMSLTEFALLSMNSYMAGEKKQTNTGSDPRLDVVIQSLQKLHDFPAVIQMLNRIFRVVDETGKGIEAMITIDKDIRQELLQKHPELRSKY